MGSNKRVLLILWISQFLLMLFGFYILIVIRLLLLVLLPLAMALQNHLFLVFLQLLQIQSLGIVMDINYTSKPTMVCLFTIQKLVLRQQDVLSPNKIVMVYS